MRISVIILVVALVGGCGSNDARDGLALALESPPSQAGEEVTLILRNGSDSQVGYNLCTARLSRQRAGQWVLVDSRSSCPPDQQMLEPRDEDTHSVQLPEELEGGSYRFSMRVEVGGTRIQEIHSPTFQMPETTPDTTATVAEPPAS